MKFKSEEYSITNVMPTKDGDVQGICISRKALEWWREHYRNKADELRKSGDVEREIYYIAKEGVLIQILQHFEEEEL